MTKLLIPQPWADEMSEQRPIIQCEYAHAMGNGNGNYKEYWDAFEANSSMQVFIRPHCVLKHTPPPPPLHITPDSIRRTCGQLTHAGQNRTAFRKPYKYHPADHIPVKSRLEPRLFSCSVSHDVGREGHTVSQLAIECSEQQCRVCLPVQQMQKLCSGCQEKLCISTPMHLRFEGR